MKHWQASLIIYKVKPTTNPLVYFSVKNKRKTEKKKRLSGLTRQNIKFFCTPLPKKNSHKVNQKPNANWEKTSAA